MKADKLKEAEQRKIFEKTLVESKEHVACYPEIILTSSEKGLGIRELQGAIYQALEGL